MASTETFCVPRYVRNPLCIVTAEDHVVPSASEADDIDLPLYLFYECTKPWLIVAAVKRLYIQRYRTMSCDLAGAFD